MEELLDDPETCKNHAFEAVPFQEILGFRVADNEFTKEIIYRIITRVLHIASYSGFRQEYREACLEAAKESGGDYEPYMPIDEWSRFSFCVDREHVHFGYGETVENREKLKEVWMAIYEYEMCSMKREREIILRSHGR